MNIKDAFDYFDEKMLKYEPLIKMIEKGKRFVFNIKRPKSDLDTLSYDIIVDDVILASGKCHLMGFYSKEHSIWQWAWSMTTDMEKSRHHMARKLLISVIDLGNAGNDNGVIDVMQIIRSAMLSSKLHVEHRDIEMDVYMSLAMYLTKAELFLPTNVGKEGFYYYTLQTINIMVEENL